MKTIKINKIYKELFSGKVYNLELESSSEHDDLFWIEKITGIVNHNCLPKDISAVAAEIKQMGLNTIEFFENIIKENEKY